MPPSKDITQTQPRRASFRDLTFYLGDILLEKGYVTRLGTPSAAELARATGVNWWMAHRFINGMSMRIDAELVARTCAWLGVQPGDLIKYEPEE